MSDKVWKKLLSIHYQYVSTSILYKLVNSGHQKFDMIVLKTETFFVDTLRDSAVLETRHSGTKTKLSSLWWKRHQIFDPKNPHLKFFPPRWSNFLLSLCDLKPLVTRSSLGSKMSTLSPGRQFTEQGPEFFEL